MPTTVAGLAVAVTGAATPVGAAIAEGLARDDRIGRVVAIDDRAKPAALPDGITWRRGDVRDPAIARRLTGVDVVVHAALDLSPDAEPRARSELHGRGTRAVVTSSAAVGVSRVVVVTSAMVYGADPGNRVPLDESAPTAAPREGLVADLLDMEQVASAARSIHPGLSVTVLRPAALVGPRIDTLVTRHFAAPRLLTVKGGTMRWQFCHASDLAAAAAVIATADEGSPLLDTALTCGAEGWLTPYDVSQASGLRRVDLPATVAFATADRLHRAGVVPAPASELAFVAYPWVVPSTALREAGWAAQVGNAEAFEALLSGLAGGTAIAGRRVGVRDATIAGAGAGATVAGATVAVLAAAAFVRRARRVRR